MLIVTEIHLASKFWGDSYSHRCTIVSQLSKTKSGLLKRKEWLKSWVSKEETGNNVMFGFLEGQWTAIIRTCKQFGTIFKVILRLTKSFFNKTLGNNKKHFWN